MKIKKFLEEQVDKGVTLYRLANVLEITHPAISKHWSGMAERVNTKLAKTIYKKFDVILDGFIEQELKE